MHVKFFEKIQGPSFCDDYWGFKLPSSTAGKDLDMTEVNALTVFKKVPLELVAIPYSP